MPLKQRETDEVHYWARKQAATAEDCSIACKNTPQAINESLPCALRGQASYWTNGDATEDLINQPSNKMVLDFKALFVSLKKHTVHYHFCNPLGFWFHVWSAFQRLVRHCLFSSYLNRAMKYQPLLFSENMPNNSCFQGVHKNTRGEKNTGLQTMQCLHIKKHVYSQTAPFQQSFTGATSS